MSSNKLLGHNQKGSGRDAVEVALGATNITERAAAIEARPI